MSLKGFHILFIIASIILLCGFSFWAFIQYKEINGILYLSTAGLSLLSALGLVFYEISFMKKVRD